MLLPHIGKPAPEIDGFGCDLHWLISRFALHRTPNENSPVAILVPPEKGLGDAREIVNNFRAFLSVERELRSGTSGPIPVASASQLHESSEHDLCP
ncbi:MAG: hypothetical protein DMG72_24505 [Acidobacteria bacterium]|nr:MAG: hypothetical protein DMG72_24505 [Acidobacteriota bacterium]